MVDENSIRLRYEAMRARLDERGRRLFAAAEARTAGRGGIAGVARATGIARSTIGRGLKDLEARGLPREWFVVRAEDGARLRRRMQRFWRICDGSSNLRRWAIRCDRCCGCRRATPSSPRRCARWGIRLQRAAFRGFLNSFTTAAKSIARPRKAAIILTGTLNLSTSTSNPWPSTPPASR